MVTETGLTVPICATEVARRGAEHGAYAAACRMLKDCDTLVDRGCNGGGVRVYVGARRPG